jgi:hypothetical protein
MKIGIEHDALGSMPVAISVYEGNTADVSTLMPSAVAGAMKSRTIMQGITVFYRLPATAARLSSSVSSAIKTGEGGAAACWSGRELRG